MGERWSLHAKPTSQPKTKQFLSYHGLKNFMIPASKEVHGNTKEVYVCILNSKRRNSGRSFQTESSLGCLKRNGKRHHPPCGLFFWGGGVLGVGWQGSLFLLPSPCVAPISSVRLQSYPAARVSAFPRKSRPDLRSAP